MKDLKSVNYMVNIILKNGFPQYCSSREVLLVWYQIYLGSQVVNQVVIIHADLTFIIGPLIFVPSRDVSEVWWCYSTQTLKKDFHPGYDIRRDLGCQRLLAEMLVR